MSKLLYTFVVVSMVATNVALGGENDWNIPYSKYGIVFPGERASSGVTSLYLAARYAGVSPSVDELAAEVRLTPDGADLKRLQDAASGLGLLAMVYEVKATDWRSLRGGLILFMKDHTYLFVKSQREDGFDVVRGTQIGFISSTELTANWTGVVLEVRAGDAQLQHPYSVDIGKSDLTLGNPIAIAQHINLGSIPGDRVYIRNVWLCNKSSDVLRVSRIRSSCGCTSWREDEDTISTAERSLLSVNFDARGIYGNFEKRVLVELQTADNRRASVFITLSGSIMGERRLFCEPFEPNFEAFLDHQARPIDVTVSRAGDAAVNLASIRSSEAWLSAELLAEKFADQLGKPDAANRVQIRLTIRQLMAVGNYNATVYVETKDALCPVLAIPVHLRVLSTIDVNPKSIFLPSLPTSKQGGADVVLNVHSQIARALQMRGLTVYPDDLKSSVSATWSNDSTDDIRVKVHLVSDAWAPRQVIQGGVTLFVDGGESANIVVPITARCTEKDGELRAK